MATLARGTSKRSFNKRKHLLLVAVKGAALLGVDEVVPVVADGQHWSPKICISPSVSHSFIVEFVQSTAAPFPHVLLPSIYLDKGGCALTSPQPTA